LAGRASPQERDHQSQASQAQPGLAQRGIQPYLHIILGGIVDLRWTPENVSRNDCTTDGFSQRDVPQLLTEFAPADEETP